MANTGASRRESRSFLLSSFISLLASVLGALASLLASRNALGALVPWLARVHWTVWVCSVPALYAIGCYISDRIHTTTETATALLRVPVWTQLRAFGDQRVARISYWALVLIPIIAYLVATNPLKLPLLENVELPLSFRLSFFASWFFARALIIFTVGCPKEFRQYNPLENAKTINLVMNDVVSPRVVIEQPQEVDDPYLDKSSLELRAVAFLFYVLGLSVATIILFRSAWFVINV
jgi:hypothetical protein